jgi:hypothetical protein
MKGDHKPTPYPNAGKQQAENANGHFSIKNFIKALRNASNAFKLVWEASKHNALFNFGLTPIAALMPAAQAWVGKLIVDNILGVLNANMGWEAGMREVLPVVLLELGLVLVSSIVSQARALSNRMMSMQLTTHVNTLIIRKPSAWTCNSLRIQFSMTSCRTPAANLTARRSQSSRRPCKSRSRPSRWFHSLPCWCVSARFWR